jgi:hypothetical protein
MISEDLQRWIHGDVAGASKRRECRKGAAEYLIGMDSASGIEFGRKDLRSIPKVFLIDACEVS